MSFNVYLVVIRIFYINVWIKVSNMVDCVIYNFNFFEFFL